MGHIGAMTYSMLVELQENVKLTIMTVTDDDDE